MLVVQCEADVFCALIGGRGRIGDDPWRTFGDPAVRHGARRPPPPPTSTARRGSSVDYFHLDAATDKTLKSSISDIMRVCIEKYAKPGG